ncbi:hypothetical protein CDD83_3287 [Cordyceps sp. RAO-2017]|nr:hypothetical protein CDD83_3287 [Cordyceps sp. RAO-2017]
MSTARCTAQDAVLTLPDTLEAILLCLDLKTLLVSAMRVSTHWNRVMAASPAIQHALYLRPAPSRSGRGSGPRGTASVDAPDEGSGLNPLLVEKFGRLFFELGSLDSGAAAGGFVRRASAFCKLPWCRRSAESALVDPPRDGRGGIEYGQVDARVVAHEPGRRRRFTRRDASWRRMLVSQPPPPAIGYFAMTTQWSLSSPFSAGLVPPRNGSFVCMGDLYDLVQGLAGHHEHNSAWFRVTWRRLRGPSPSLTARLACQELLRQTSVLVEFEHVGDGFYVDPDPLDEEAVRQFDAAFRCDDFQPPDLRRVRHDRHVSERAGFPLVVYTS